MKIPIYVSTCETHMLGAQVTSRLSRLSGINIGEFRVAFNRESTIAQLDSWVASARSRLGVDPTHTSVTPHFRKLGPKMLRATITGHRGVHSYVSYVTLYECALELGDQVPSQVFVNYEVDYMKPRQGVHLKILGVYPDREQSKAVAMRRAETLKPLLHDKLVYAKLDPNKFMWEESDYPKFGLYTSSLMAPGEYQSTRWAVVSKAISVVDTVSPLELLANIAR